MSQSDLSILIVDDAKFSASVISKNLTNGGFSNLTHTHSAAEALEIQNDDPKSVVIADWLMPEMDGLEMTKRIRQMDEAANRYTYIIMLTARDGVDALKHAFEEGIDDFVNKAAMQAQLLPRIYAAQRLVDNQTRMLMTIDNLLAEKQHLESINSKLKDLCTIDSLTGLGNRVYAQTKLDDNLRHTDSRGGASCLILLRFADVKALEQQFPTSIIQELTLGISRRIKSLIRPLDDFARTDKYSFAVISHQPELDYCVGKNFKRILEAVNTRAFKTSMGFQQIAMNMIIVASNAEQSLPSSKVLFAIAERKIAESNPHSIHHIHYNPSFSTEN
jgi:PleD family two-component response regulator